MTAAREFVALLTDPRTFESWDEAVAATHWPDFVDTKPYRWRLTEAKKRTGEDESVLTGMASIGGNRVALVICEFGFLGGSMGVVAGERITRAFERAGALGIPLVGVVASGGVRMQEGVPAFLQMVKTADAARRFREAGGGFVAYLAGPAMGGVVASWASLAQVIFCAPGVLVGLTGPRVVEAVTESSALANAQRAEQLFAAGRIDELVAPEALRGRLEEVLRFFSAAALQRQGPSAPTPESDQEIGIGALPRKQGDPWLAVQHTRNPLRPGAAELLLAAGSLVCTLRGDGAGGIDDPSCLAGPCWFDGVPIVVIAQVRRGARRASLGPSGYRKARRAVALAAELAVPLLTVIDTCGAEMSAEAELGGLAAEIARCVADLVAVHVPTVAVLLGEGTGGGALALLAADVVVAAEQAWLAPLAPEGSSALLFRTPTRAAEAAQLQRISAPQLLEQRIIDTVVPETPDAAKEAEGFLARMSAAVSYELRRLLKTPSEERLEERRRRYRDVGANVNVQDKTVLATGGDQRGRSRRVMAPLRAQCR